MLKCKCDFNLQYPHLDLDWEHLQLVTFNNCTRDLKPSSKTVYLQIPGIKRHHSLLHP